MLQPGVLPKPSSLYGTNAIADFNAVAFYPPIWKRPIPTSGSHTTFVANEKIGGRQTKPGVNTCMRATVHHF
ncbi:hypothetical protein M427DRAFT_55039 [Gonapodya prolifera JEL478]|uniref:Uncharacterized protein n=1 Tax=Gonapodya prolifera (strain JEL478) TaxID=1344416 RepID=A0A139AKR2_GONPJ|nr:hypothetical protein M427DRAFT_55039 [Gonapodya prolifera JEL478]|eukprot:KXS17015.1 hypothetical protein M427DRAFT_55039 [Gonapodya prolifera JEL478]